MVDRFINASIFAYDNFAAESWFNILDIGGYPVLGVIWNLTLLAVPFYIAKILESDFHAGKFHTNRGRAAGVIFFIVWLFFIPNAAYIITDARHLATVCSAASYYKVCPETAWLIPVFFSYAAVGWAAFVYLLRQMENLIFKMHGPQAGLFFILAAIPAVSLGALLGLLNRFNSWEVFTSPISIIDNSLVYFTDPVYFKNFAIFTIALYFLYWTGDRIFKKLG